MKKVLMRIIEMVCLLAIIGGSLVIGYRIYCIFADDAGQKETKSIREKVEEEQEEEKALNNTSKSEGVEVDSVSESETEGGQYSDYSDKGKKIAQELLGRLREKYGNDDVIGYLVLNGYDVEYPIMYGETNDSYIKTDPYGNYYYNGSIFLDSENRPDFSDSRSVLYGHNMRDGSMFGCLRSFYAEDLSDKQFTIYTNNGISVYDILCSETVYAFEDNYCLFPSKKYAEEYHERGYSDNEIESILSSDPNLLAFFDEAKRNCLCWNERVEYDDVSKVVTLMTCYQDGKTHRLGVTGVLRVSPEDFKD